MGAYLHPCCIPIISIWLFWLIFGSKCCQIWNRSLLLRAGTLGFSNRKHCPRDGPTLLWNRWRRSMLSFTLHISNQRAGVFLHLFSKLHLSCASQELLCNYLMPLFWMHCCQWKDSQIYFLCLICFQIHLEERRSWASIPLRLHYRYELFWLVGRLVREYSKHYFSFRVEPGRAIRKGWSFCHHFSRLNTLFSDQLRRVGIELLHFCWDSAGGSKNGWFLILS